MLLFVFLCFPLSILTVLLLGKAVDFLRAGSGSVAANLCLHSRACALEQLQIKGIFSVCSVFSLVKDMEIYKRETTEGDPKG